MMKGIESLKIEQKAASGLSALLHEVPFAEVEQTDLHPVDADSGIDFILDVRANGRPYKLVAEVKNSGQPRRVREAILELRNYIAHLPNAVPVFVAPYISEEARQICRDNDVNFYDLEGNCLIILASAYIERSVASKPAAERREMKSLFKPKSARVLRYLLRDPLRPYRLSEIADQTRVSVGQVHNVKEALLAREWADSPAGGLVLTKPSALLDAWRDNYERPQGEKLEFYTTLHGSQLEKALREALPPASQIGDAVLASYSAANWIAPYGRNETTFLYADKAALEALKEPLRLSSGSRGANVAVTLPNDDGVFLDRIEPAPGVYATSAVQTYLDLSQLGERGREAAEHLRKEALEWAA